MTFLAKSEKHIPTSFQSGWFRGSLHCLGSKSPPRERAIARVLEEIRPNWRTLDIHESSPGGWAFSAKLRRECTGYVASQYDPTFLFGEMHSAGKWRNEDLEAQTFADESFDIVVTQDVFEHLFHPGRAAKEIARTLKPGGLCLMTVPVVRKFGETERRASLIEGRIVHHLPEQYHGNPVSNGQSLVTVDWSYDIGAHLSAASGMPFVVMLIDDMAMGIRDPVNTILVGRKGALPVLREDAVSLPNSPILTLILGVHRSGTSLLTQGLIAAGADAALFDDVRDVDNPDGYAEHPQVRHFNERLLAYLGVSWDNWGFRANEMDLDGPSFKSWRAEATALLRETFSGSGPFVLKDPRCSTVAPFWERVIQEAGFILKRILILRDPTEVAESQRQRAARQPHRFTSVDTSEPMAALWSVTMIEVLDALADDQTLLVTHADLLANPVETLSRAAEFAGCQPNDEAMAAFAANDVNASLYRARAADIHRTDGTWMHAAKSLYNSLLVAGTPRMLSVSEARQIAQDQSELQDLMRALPAIRSSIELLHKSVDAHRDTNARLSALMWSLGPAATRAPTDVLLATTEKIWDGARNSPPPADSFAYTYTVGRMLLAAGRLSDARVWLENARSRFGDFSAFQAFERQLSDGELKAKNASPTEL